MAIVEVEQLGVEYRIDRKWRNAIYDFNITIAPRQIYGVVGESGSGKSTVIKAIIRYLSKNARITGGHIWFEGEDLVQKSRGQMRSLWGSKIHMVPQNPFAALNPSIKIGEQIAEIIRIHDGKSKQQVQAQVYEMLSAVRLADPPKIANRYPHELSGGQQQRVVLAMSFATTPQLLLLDEPTTGLDVTTEAAILDLIRDLVARTDAGAMYVTHNLGVVAQFCQRVMVMYGGEIMADASVEQLFNAPTHPYTIGLLACIPRFGVTRYDAMLHTLPGRPPSLVNKPHACVFADRCPVALDICRQVKPPLEDMGEGRKVRCHRWREIADGSLLVEQAFPTDTVARRPESEPLLKVNELSKQFPVRLDVVDWFKQQRGATISTSINAVNSVNLNIQRGHTLGLVGESGSGKTTLARLMVGLTQPTSGEMTLMGMKIEGKVSQRSKETLRQLQMVFQNPQASLNPYLSIGQALRRPLIKLAGLGFRAANQQAKELLKAVNLDESYMRRFPNDLSGGERQRVAIARAFASNPELIVCDEPVSALDVSVQALVLNLLAKLQDERGTAYLFISHDLAVVGYIADYLAVMYLGELFEVGYGKDLFTPPYHPYTEALLSAIPYPDPHRQTQHIRLSDDVPSPRHLPTGCRFHTRCPRKQGVICETESPPWHEDGNGHYIRCHISIEELTALQTMEVQA